MSVVTSTTSPVAGAWQAPAKPIVTIAIATVTERAIVLMAAPGP